jgi:hypothetical protein
MRARLRRSLFGMRNCAGLVVMTALWATGCGAVAHPGQATATSYQLYTHCGIEWAKINGTYWKAEHLLSDGNGNPPAGWGNPFEHGTLTFTNARTARFTSAAGTVTFSRTKRASPPSSCS